MKIIQLSALILPIAVAIAAVPSSAQQTYIKYLCEDGKTFDAQVLDDRARIRLKTDRPLTLLPVDSTEGLKFSDGYTLLRVNGNQASIEYKYQMVFDRCVAQ